VGCEHASGLGGVCAPNETAVRRRIYSFTNDERKRSSIINVNSQDVRPFSLASIRCRTSPVAAISSGVMGGIRTRLSPIAAADMRRSRSPNDASPYRPHRQFRHGKPTAGLSRRPSAHPAYISPPIRPNDQGVQPGAATLTSQKTS
jgi:hypothetical protein